MPIHYIELMTPWTPWGVQTGSARWTWPVATGRLEWERKINQRLLLWPEKGFSSSRSCHLGFPMHLPRFRDSWKRSWWAYNGKKCLVYVDDIIMFGRNFGETLENLECVVERLKQAGLKLKPSKCRWFQKSVKYLGHIVSKKALNVTPRRWRLSNIGQCKPLWRRSGSS